MLTRKQLDLLNDLDLNELIYKLKKEGIVNESIPFNVLKHKLRKASREMSQFTHSSRPTHILNRM